MVGFNDSISILAILKRAFGLDVTARSKKVKASKKCLHRIRKRFSLPLLVYAIVLHVSYSAAFGIHTPFGSNYKVSVLDYGLSMMFVSVGVMSMVVTIFWCLKNAERLSELKSSIDMFDLKFKMLGGSIDNKSAKDFTIFGTVIVLVYWIAFFGYYVFLSCDYGTVYCLKSWFATYQPHKILLVAFFEELVLVYGLNARFRSLNEMILNMGTDTVMCTRSKSPSAMALQRGTIARMVHCRELHYFLCDVGVNLNNTFSLQTVVNILDCFVNIFVMLYLACFGYSRDEEKSDVNYNALGIFLPIFVGSEAFVKIFFLAKYCDAVQTESKKSGEIIHKISIYSLDEYFKNEIMIFSNQILHKHVRITACGMFSIDYSLVFNVIASVTTFIVILIQFALAIKYSPSGTFTTITDSTERYEQTGAFST